MPPAAPPSPRPEPAAVNARQALHGGFRLDSLRTKLFAAIAGTNMVLVLLVYLVYSWSFDQGMAEYLNKEDDARLAPLVRRLATDYATKGSWNWIADDRSTWYHLMREELGARSVERSQGDDKHEHDDKESSKRPRVSAPTWTDGRLLLLDASRQPRIGKVERTAELVLTPIELKGEVIGYLARTPRQDVVQSLERVLSAQQRQQFGVIAMAMLLAVVVNAAWIARWLAKRLARLGEGAAAVARGDYSMRLQESGEDEIAQLSHDFNRMAMALQKAQQARQQWIADIAHELRTPLAGLRAEIEALQDGVRQPTPDRMASLAQEVVRLTRLVDDLRLLSLSDMGALDYHLRPLDLGEWVADFLRDAPQALSPDLQVEQVIAPKLWVQADADRLTQVLTNLLQNTHRYSHAPATLQVRVQGDGKEACITWQDSAPGVPPEALAHLTDRLYRLDDSRARVSGGSGLGLSIALAVIEAHQGRMQASMSELGGLRWDIWLPLTAPVR